MIGETYFSISHADASVFYIASPSLIVSSYEELKASISVLLFVHYGAWFTKHFLYYVFCIGLNSLQARIRSGRPGNALSREDMELNTFCDSYILGFLCTLLLRIILLLGIGQ